MAVKPWQEVHKDVKAKIRAGIPAEWILANPPPESQTNVMDVPYTCGIMTTEELEITDMDATELIERMSTGKLKSYDVTLAFCKRAAIAEQLACFPQFLCFLLTISQLNCLSEVFFDEALERAKAIDDEFAKTGKPIGPFHGLPFSIKTHWNIEGKEASAGYVAWAYNVADKDAPTVAILRKAGAVFYVKCTAPQTLMHLETVSNLWGRTLNPFNRALTPGGSSGGDSALVSFHGSPMGLAADGGGSIRAPAADCGLIGLKATSDRIPVGGNTFAFKGCASFPCVGGPVCRSVRDQLLFMKTIIGACPWLTEPELPPVPWREVTLPPKLTIGIYLDDGLCMPHPTITKTLEWVKTTLAGEADVDVVEFKPYDHKRGYDLIRSMYFQDGGADNYRLFKEADEPCLELSSWIMKDSHTRRRTLEETWLQRYDREVYRKEYADYWAEKYPHVDYVICPMAPSVAPRHDTSKCWSYTAIYNCLDWPACAFPTGLHVDPAKFPKPEYTPRDTEFDAFNWGLYEPELYKDAPISLQLVGKKWDCEGVLAAVDKVTQLLAKAPKF